jgi:hypothetical protein
LKLITSILMIYIFFAACCSGQSSYNDEYEYRTTQGYIFNSNQQVEGNGFANEHELIDLLAVDSKAIRHGSGYYKRESILYAQNSTYFQTSSQDYLSSAERKIETKESVDMVYAERMFNFEGTFSAGPFRSLWKEENVLHQNSVGLAMRLEIDQASRISKDLSSKLVGTAFTEKYIDPRSSSKSIANLSFEANFEGRANFGIIAGKPQIGETGISDDLLIDENYIGDISITKKIQFETLRKRISDNKTYDESWLPCCPSGGWEFMYPLDKKAFGEGANRIFDCTCQEQHNR